MSLKLKLMNAAGIVLPLAAVFCAIGMLWGRYVGMAAIVILAVGYVLTGLGITVGFHRLFTHRSFQTSPAMRYLFAVLGEMAVESDVITWVADHRKHHQFSDQQGDPHSPHAGYDDTWRDALHGLWHAHAGWLFIAAGRADKRRYAKDLIADQGMRLIARLFVPIMLAGLALPTLAGYLIIGGWQGALAGLVWGGGVRVFLLHHVTFSINSICHFFGRRRFASRDESRNVWWLSLLSFGESWHNNHHAFPTSAAHGLSRIQRATDPGAWTISLLERLGLIWNVTRIGPERQAAKAL